MGEARLKARVVESGTNVEVKSKETIQKRQGHKDHTINGVERYAMGRKTLSEESD